MQKLKQNNFFISFISLGLMTPTLWAQNADKKPERIQVTGSRIKKIDAEGTNPVTVIGKEQIEKTGSSTVRDLLQNFSGSTASFNGGGASVAGGVATVSLKGLGADRTLVLIDGVRLPKHPELAAVDLNSIPIAAIEKIDILRQSASAVYGADAVGGVINIITKKNYSGTQVQVQVKKPTKPGGDSQSISATTGFTTDNTSSVLVFNYTHQAQLIAKDRDFARDRNSLTGYPGTYSGTVGGVAQTFAAAGCPNYSESNGQVNQAPGCDFNYNNFNSLLPSYDRLSGLYNFSLDLPNNKIFTAKLIASHQKTKSQLRPEGTLNRDLNARIDKAVVDGMDEARFRALFPGFNGNRPADGIGLNLRFATFGNSVTEKEANLVGVTTGLEGDFGNGWDWKVSANASGTATSSNSFPKLRIAETNAALNEGRLIPWDPNLDIATLRNTLLVSSHYLEKSNTAGLELQTSGQIGTLNEQAIGVAIGASVQNESFDVEWDTPSSEQQLLNVAGSPGKGDREVMSLFAEANLVPLPKVEAGLAARFDQYSDSGSTFNPQLSLSYSPLQELKLRGSAGTAFKAPSLRNMYGASGVSFNPVVDYVYCKNQVPEISRDDCPNNPEANKAIKNVRTSNENLDPEKSEILAFGFVAAPVEALTITADYWKIKSRDIIDYRELQDLVDEEDPAVVRSAANNNTIEYIDLPIQNLSKSTIAGIDAGLDYGYRMGDYLLAYQGLGTWYLENKTQPAGRPEKNDLGRNGVYKWKFNHSLDLGFRDQYGIALVANTVGTHGKQADDTQRLPQFTRYDLQTRYKGTWNGDIAFGVVNLLNKQGGIDDTAMGDVNSSIYDIQGREYYLRVTQNF